MTCCVSCSIAMATLRPRSFLDTDTRTRHARHDATRRYECGRTFCPARLGQPSCRIPNTRSRTHRRRSAPLLPTADPQAIRVVTRASADLRLKASKDNLKAVRDYLDRIGRVVRTSEARNFNDSDC